MNYSVATVNLIGNGMQLSGSVMYVKNQCLFKKCFMYYVLIFFLLFPPFSLFLIVDGHNVDGLLTSVTFLESESCLSSKADSASDFLLR